MLLIFTGVQKNAAAFHLQKYKRGWPVGHPLSSKFSFYLT